MVLRGPRAVRHNTQSILLAPVKDRYSILMEDDKLRVGASSMQGWRSTMEDAHIVSMNMPGSNNSMLSSDGALVGIFDGHCGSKMAQACAANIAQWISTSAGFSSGNYTQALIEAFLHGDSNLYESMPMEASGCTGNCVLIVQNHLYCVNAGDTRAVLCRNGEAIPLSEDHKPTNPKEMERIERSGGFVQSGRVNGVLSLSRAFGDFALKNMGGSPDSMIVSVKPDVVHLELEPQDEFVIVACDGVWDMMTNEQAVGFVREEVANHGDLSLACEELMNACLAPTPTTYGTDNMTVILLQFKSSFLKKVECKFT